MLRGEAVIGSKVGLHARPAAVFVKAVNESQIPEVTIQKEGGDPVNAGSMLSVMLLGAKHGDRVKLTIPASSVGAVEQLQALLLLLEADLER